MQKRKYKLNVLMCAIVLPLVLSGCGSGKPPNPCKDSHKTIKGPTSDVVKEKADRFIKAEKRNLLKKHGSKITFKPVEKKCTKLEKKKDEAGNEVIIKPVCEVKIPYCIAVPPVPGEKPKPVEAVPAAAPETETKS